MSTIAEEAFAPLPNIIEPKWWNGEYAIAPERFVIDGNKFRVNDAPLKPSAELEEAMQQTYDAVGLVHVVNTGLEDLTDMRAIATQVLKNARKYEGGANPRKAIAPNVYEIGAPLEAWL
ncbi:MAG: syringomycin synthesis regulator SyrP, partial [Bacteroidetes bacterium]